MRGADAEQRCEQDTLLNDAVKSKKASGTRRSGSALQSLFNAPSLNIETSRELKDDRKAVLSEIKKIVAQVPRIASIEEDTEHEQRQQGVTTQHVAASSNASYLSAVSAHSVVTDSTRRGACS